MKKLRATEIMAIAALTALLVAGKVWENGDFGIGSKSQNVTYFTIRTASGQVQLYKQDGANVFYFIDGIAFQTGAAVSKFSTDGSMSGNSDAAVPTEQAVKTYADTKADKVVGATMGNFPAFDDTGNLIDSGNSDSDFAYAQDIANAAQWDQAYNDLVNGKATWDSTANTVSTKEGDWDNTANIVSTKEASWDSVASTVATKEGGWDNTANTVSTKEGDWDAAYTHSMTGGNPHGITKADLSLENVANSLQFYQDASHIPGISQGDMFYRGESTVERIPKGVEGQILRQGADTPEWGFVNLVLTGSVQMWPAQVSVPTGYVFCNGQAVSRSTYSALFAALGTAYGPGDGSTTFNLPMDNLRYGYNFTALSAGAEQWSGMDYDANGGVYVCDDSSGDIYYQTAGTGAFNALSQTASSWRAVAVSRTTGDVYACTYGGDIYMRTAGAGNFNALSQTSRNWIAMCSDLSGNIYAAAYGGDIYVRSGGTGNFNALSETSRNWYGLGCDPTTGDIYATVTSGDIYIRAGGTGTFTAIGGTSRNWRNIAFSQNGDAYAAVESNYLYVKYKGNKNFIALDYPPAAALVGVCVTPKGDIYYNVRSADIYQAKRQYINIIKY